MEVANDQQYRSQLTAMPYTRSSRTCSSKWMNEMRPCESRRNPKIMNAYVKRLGSNGRFRLTWNHDALLQYDPILYAPTSIFAPIIKPTASNRFSIELMRHPSSLSDYCTSTKQQKASNRRLRHFSNCKNITNPLKITPPQIDPTCNGAK